MINVLFFGKFSDFVAVDEDWRMASEGIETVADVVAAVGRRNPQLHSQITAPQVTVALNQQVASVDAAVVDGDEIAFLPPVTGG